RREPDRHVSGRAACGRAKGHHSCRTDPLPFTPRPQAIMPRPPTGPEITCDGEVTPQIGVDGPRHGRLPRPGRSGQHTFEDRLRARSLVLRLAALGWRACRRPAPGEDPDDA